MMTLGVAGHAREVAVHRNALRGCRDIQLVHRADCASVLEQKIDGLVVLHVEDKSHWISAAVAAGLHVMATHPVQESFANSHPNVCVLSLGRHTHFCAALAAQQGVVHYSLELSFDSALFDPIGREMIYNQAALDVCDLLLSTWGPVDVLYSRMRNFFHPGRMEDVSVVLLRMHNGIEGSVALMDFPAVAPALRIRRCMHRTKSSTSLGLGRGKWVVWQRIIAISSPVSKGARSRCWVWGRWSKAIVSWNGCACRRDKIWF